MRLGHSALVVVFALVANAATAACPQLSPVQGTLGYSLRKNPDRCEGLYQSPISGEVLELLSFTRGPIAFDPEVDRVLTITTPVVPVLSGAVVSITAQALPPRVYYRMDATVISGDTLKWPLSDVIIPAGISASELGVLGSVSRGRDTVFVPVSISVEKNSAVTIFRAAVDLDILQWRLIVSGSAPAAWNTFGDPNQVILAGDRISLQFQPRQPGLVTLDVAARPAGGDYTRIQKQVIVP